MNRYRQHALGGVVMVMMLVAGPACLAGPGGIEADAISKASGAKAAVQADGVVRIGWKRDDVKVTVDGEPFPASAGLGSWAAFQATGDGAMVMGDTVVFCDEVEPAIDAAFAHGLDVTALHNHFFYDEPKVFFMHIGGRGDPVKLAEAVKSVWDAIKKVRHEHPTPANGFGGPHPTTAGHIDADRIEKITGLKPVVSPEMVKVSSSREGEMQETTVGGAMGLGSWAAFVGSNELASVDGDFIMTGPEVQPVLHALRRSQIHIVALHNHMIGEEPAFYFVHFWSVGPADMLAEGFRAALDAQAGSDRDKH
jgi:hypothetical protein